MDISVNCAVFSDDDGIGSGSDDEDVGWGDDFVSILINVFIPP